MRFAQSDIAEYQDILLYTFEENNTGIYPFFVQKVFFDANFVSLLHRHDYFQIYYISKGKLRHCIHDKAFDLAKGDVFVIPPYESHRIASCGNAPCEVIELEFKPEFINQSFGDDADVKPFLDFMYIEPFMVVRPRLSLTGMLEFDVESLLKDFMSEYTERRPGFELMVKSMLLKLLAMLGREAAYGHKASKKADDDSKQMESVQRAVDYIEKHFTEKIYLKDAMKASLLSYSCFCKAFKSITGKSFTRYLNELRVSKAKEYLKNTDNKIVDICNRTGFENVTHFNRIFKQIMAMTPKEYKQMNR